METSRPHQARAAGTRPDTAAAEDDRVATRFNVAAVLLGVGFGGFVDGIVLHQILQWHHMLTSTGDHPATTIAGLETNTLWDGLFHVGTWIAALVGVLMLSSAMRDGFRGTSPHLIGLIFAGWGAFNLVEGTVDHHILGIHHVRAGSGEWAYDLGFLLLGAALLLGGLGMARRASASGRGA